MQFFWVSGKHVLVMVEESISLNLPTSNIAQMREESGQCSNNYQSNVIFVTPQGKQDNCFNCYDGSLNLGYSWNDRM